ncbi:MAG: Ppx/GppA phosphatase family protein [Bryobacteraceae bacterium]
MPKYAAVDIGSNSLRMEVAEIGADQPMKVLAADREVTRLGESVFRDGRVSGEAMDLTCSVLARMAKIYQKLDVAGVRAVATSAIRDARNQEEFIRRASQSIGTHVETISGAEESRLIHLGVVTRWPRQKYRTLIVDIGGGSAELILSDNGTLVEAFSKPLGAVRLKEVFLKNDPPTPSELRQMEEYIRAKIYSALKRIPPARVQRVIGTSATANAVVCAAHRVARDEREDIDRRRASTPQVRALYEAIKVRDVVARTRIPGFGPRRAEIIVPGMAVLIRVLEEFGQPGFYYCSAGVRDGIVADLFARGVGRELTMLSRDQRRVVETLARHYGVDRARARRIAQTAHSLFAGLEQLHGLPKICGKLLQAAAMLIDAGHYVSDSRHHRHSQYLVAHSALPGFTDREREVIANLCRYHRKSMPSAEHPEFQGLEPDQRQAVLRLAPLLRLADALERGRKPALKGVECRLRKGEIEVRLKAKGDVDLEQWAAAQTRDAFRQVYQQKLTVTRV